MASRVSTMSLVCEPEGISLRWRHMYFAPWLLLLIAFSTARLTSSFGFNAGGPSAAPCVARLSARAVKSICRHVRNSFGLMGSRARPSRLDEKLGRDVV